METCPECGAEVVAPFDRCDDGKHYDERNEYVGKVVSASAEMPVQWMT